MDAQTIALIVGAIVVLIAASAVFRIIARLVWAFSICAAVLLYFHFQHDPAEALAGYAALGGGHLIRRPLIRMLGVLT